MMKIISGIKDFDLAPTLNIGLEKTFKEYKKNTAMLLRRQTFTKN
jgi:hypothetical protein